MVQVGAAGASNVKNQLDEYLPNWGRPWYRVRHLMLLNLCLMVPMLSVTTNGYDGSMLNGLQSVTQWQDYFGHPSGAVLGALSNGTTFGAIICFPFAAWISDKWGRKRAIILGAIIATIGAALQAASQDYAMFMVSRMIIGFGSLISVVSSPSLISELAYPTHRPVVTACYNSLWYLGALIAAWTTYGTYFMKHSEWSWRLPSLVQGFMPIVQVLTTPWIPESPRFLVASGQYEKAREVLLKWHGGDDQDQGVRLVDFEMAEIVTAIEHEKQQKDASYLEFLKTKANRRRLAIITVLPITMQFCGNGLVSYYLSLVLNSIGITSSTEQLVINGSLMVYNLGIAIICAVAVGYLPRRKSFLTGVASMLVVFVIWTVLSAINQKRDFKQKSLGQGVLAMIFLFYAAYNLALNGLPYLYFTEILPFKLRAKGINWVNFVTQLVLVFNGFVNPIAMEHITWRYYIVFCGMLAIEFAAIYFIFPETKGYTLEEVAVVFGDATEEDVNAVFEEKHQETVHQESVEV